MCSFLTLSDCCIKERERETGVILVFWIIVLKTIMQEVGYLV